MMHTAVGEIAVYVMCPSPCGDGFKRTPSAMPDGGVSMHTGKFMNRGDPTFAGRGEMTAGR